MRTPIQYRVRTRIWERVTVLNNKNYSIGSISFLTTYKSDASTRLILNSISPIPPTGTRSLPVLNSSRRFCKSLFNAKVMSQKFLKWHRKWSQPDIITWIWLISVIEISLCYVTVKWETGSYTLRYRAARKWNKLMGARTLYTMLPGGPQMEQVLSI